MFITEKEKLELLYKISEIAVSTGKFLNEEFKFDAGVELSKAKDIKTKADFAVNDFVVSELKKISDLKIVSEEDKRSHCYVCGSMSEPILIVDPLDGTMNFTRAFPAYCVSIALWFDGKAILGVIYDISRNIIYSGISGITAWENNIPISVSNVSEMNNAIIATGFPSGREYDTNSLLSFVKKVQNFKKVRMIGSAALSIAQVAVGSFDVYSEEDIYIWDVAAGLAIVDAAGGKIRCSTVKENGKLDVIAWNGKFDIQGLL